MPKVTITQTDFTTMFHRMGRGDQFTHAALCTLFDYYAEIEADTGAEIDVDVIAICCEWSEHTREDLKSVYVDMWTSALTGGDDGAWERFIDSLHNSTTVIDVAGTYLVQNF